MLIFITLCLQISHLSGIVWLPLPLVWDWWSSPWLVGVQVSHVCVNTSLMSLSGIFCAVTVLFLVTSSDSDVTLKCVYSLSTTSYPSMNSPWSIHCLSFSFSLLAGGGIGIDVLPPQLFLGPPWSSYSLWQELQVYHFLLEILWCLSSVRSGQTVSCGKCWPINFVIFIPLIRFS